MELLEMRDRHHLRSSEVPRELPVDVPDSFVGVVKTTPRYPPPHLPSNQTTSIVSNGNRSSGQSLESEKMKRYGEEVRHKRSQEEFLRSSLRGSKTLQQLEQRRPRKSSVDAIDSSSAPIHSMVNPAFEPDFDSSSQEQSKGSYFLFLTTISS
jgi:hypothetical protein